MGAVKTILIALFLAGMAPSQGNATGEAPEWTRTLAKQVALLEKVLPGELGLYVREMGTDREFSLRGDERWYLASGVKVPIAIEVLRQVDEGRFTLSTRVRIERSDFLDGAGRTNFHRPETFVSVRFLLEQMLIHSDNTASDLLIRKVGLDQVNRLVKELLPGEDFQVTTLSDVRRNLYAGIHPAAFRLQNRDFLLLKSISDEKRKFLTLARLAGRRPEEFRFVRLDDAYSDYYSRGLNSAPLRSIALLLEKAFSGRILSPFGTRSLVDILERVETGKKRIKAGLPPSVVFAHKTGTQHKRICDFGVARNSKNKRVLIAACIRNAPDLKRAEQALRILGVAMSQAGVFSES